MPISDWSSDVCSSDLFDRPQSVDYERYDGFASYDEEREHVVIGVDLGYSSLNRERESSNASAPLVRARLEWTDSGRSTLSANINYEFADAAGDVVSRADRKSTRLHPVH